jgi:two-component system sensor histidine kinase KdpD
VRLGPTSPITSRLAASTGGLVIATAIGVAIDADVATASLMLLVAVVAASLLGLVPGLVSALIGAALLNVRFTPPVGSFRVETTDDVVAIATFVVVAITVGSVVARSAELRREAQRRAGEAALRLDITARLVGGEAPRVVLESAARRLVDVFGFARCSITAGDDRAEAITGARAGQEIVLDRSGVQLRARASARRSGHRRVDTEVLESLLDAVATSLDRVRLQREAADAHLAAAVSRTRAGVLSAVSHNLRTPLTAIRTAADTLMAPEVALDERDQTELVQTIRDETDRLERLVTKVLDLSRIRAGGFVPEPQPVDLSGVIQAIAHRIAILRPDVAIRVDVGPDVRVANVDLTMLEQVLLNLLENAARFAPEGSEIGVRARRHRDVLALRVIDHGPGVPEAERQRIFEPFERGDRSAGGTGLGLAIVAAVVQAQSGRIVVEETEGGGATFRVEIPLS